MTKMRIIIDFVDYVTKGSTCSFKDRYNLYCPGCGITRSLKALLQFKFVESFCSNPFVIITILNIILLTTIFICNRHKADTKKRVCINACKVWWSTLLIIVVYSVVRNILLVYAGIDYLGDIL